MTARLHRLIGLAAGLFFAIVGLSGSLLVFKPEIDVALDPAAYAASGPPSVSPDAVVAAALRANPGIASGVSPPRDRSFADRTTAVVYVMHGHAGTSRVFVDPHSGRILAIRPPRSRFTDWVYDVHTALLLRDAGKNAVAIVGLVLVAASLLGLATWPGWRVRRAGLSYKRGASLRRRSYDVHKLVGITSVAFVAMLGFTGATMTWGDTVNKILAKTTPLLTAPPHLTAPIAGATPLSLAKQLALGDAAVPRSQVAYFDVKGMDGAMPAQSRRAPHDPDRSFGSTTLYLDPYSGQVARVVDPYRNPAAWYTWFFNLHSGMAWQQPALRVVIFLAGIAPATLLCTSLIVWRERTRALRRRKRDALCRPLRYAAIVTNHHE